MGCTSFGGAMLPMIEESLVHQRKWIAPDEFAEALALSQLVPGPVTLKVAAYLGYRVAGLGGLLVASFFFTLPATLLVLLGSILFFQFHLPIAFQKILTFVCPQKAC